MRLLLQDIRYACRTLVQRPGFTIVVVLTLGLGIGANTTLFSLVNAVMLKPPPIHNPEEVVELFTSTGDGVLYGYSSYLDYRTFQAQNALLSALTAFSTLPVSIYQNDRSLRVQSPLVADNYFAVLGVPMSAGRPFRPDHGDGAETQAGVIISYGLWQRLFGGDNNQLGQSIVVNGQSFTIIGIAPQGFSGAKRSISIDLWLPLPMEHKISHLPFSRLDRFSRWLTIVGPLNPNIPLSQIQARLNVTANQLALDYPGAWLDDQRRPRRITILSERDTRVPMLFREATIDYVTMLSIVVVLVLLIACANVANLIMVRTTGRHQEIAIHAALGAPPRRIIRQFLTESLVLSLAAGIISLFCAIWVSDLLLAFQPALPLPLLFKVDLDSRVLLFTGGVTLFTGLLLGLAPAFQASVRDPSAALKDTVAGISSSVKLT